MKKREITRLIIYTIIFLPWLLFVYYTNFKIFDKFLLLMIGQMIIGFIAEWIIIFIFGRGD